MLCFRSIPLLRCSTPRLRPLNRLRAWRCVHAELHGQSDGGNATMRVARKTAAALIIGDEILSGKTLDTNTQTLGRFLFRHGVVLEQTQTIADDIGRISSSVRELWNGHDLVFTSGGIGPTPDDKTYAGIAEGFDVELEVHEETVKRMKEMQADMVLNEARMRMGTLPVGCETFWTEGLWVPLVCVEGGVFVLPGIPRLFEGMLESIPVERFGGVPGRFRGIVFCWKGEGEIAWILEDVEREYGDLVDVGSYVGIGEVERSEFAVKVTVEGDDSAVVEEVVGKICKGVDGWIDKGEG